MLINLSNTLQIISSGDRIAQMVFQQVSAIEWNPVVSINETQRGSGGFGHTGKQ
ncbi:MAG: hypothetical protein NTY72_04935 [Bacteroidetes bacterium]|nr:hypothetical protein [Bacteroidota bacterium]